MSCPVPPFTSWTNPQGIGVCQDLTMNQQHNATSYNVMVQSYCKLSKTQNKLRIILIFIITFLHLIMKSLISELAF